LIVVIGDDKLVTPLATLTIRITVEQIRELAPALSPRSGRRLLDSLLAERFDAVLSESDRRRGTQTEVRTS